MSCIIFSSKVANSPDFFFFPHEISTQNLSQIRRPK